MHTRNSNFSYWNVGISTFSHPWFCINLSIWFHLSQSNIILQTFPHLLCCLNWAPCLFLYHTFFFFFCPPISSIVWELFITKLIPATMRHIIQGTDAFCSPLLSSYWPLFSSNSAPSSQNNQAKADGAQTAQSHATFHSTRILTRFWKNIW